MNEKEKLAKEYHKLCSELSEHDYDSYEYDCIDLELFGVVCAAEKLGISVRELKSMSDQ